MRRASLVLIVALASLLGGCKSAATGEDEKTGPSVLPLVQVETIEITSGDVQDVLNVTGRCDALRKSRIITPIAGKILMLGLTEGDHVDAGTVVAKIRTREDDALLTGSIARERDTSINDANRIAVWERPLELQTDIAGIVSSRSATAGEYVTENQELLTIIEPQSLVFMADVPLRELSKVHVGMIAEVSLPSLGGRRVNAVIQKFDLQADSSAQTARAVMRFTSLNDKDRGALKIGMTASATMLLGGHTHALLVPKGSLLRNDETNEYSIVVAGSDSIAHIMSVQIAGYRDSLAAISGDGLKSGMRVITVGQYGLADSTRIIEAHAAR